jgi:hypothetical protein
LVVRGASGGDIWEKRSCGCAPRIGFFVQRLLGLLRKGLISRHMLSKF